MQNSILKKYLFVIANIFLIFLIHIIPVSAGQNNWSLIKQEKDGSKIYMDMDNLIYKNNTVKLWMKTIYTINNPIFKKHQESLREMGKQDDLKEVVFIEEINCNENVFRVLTSIFYNASGETIIRLEHDNPTWDTIPPGNIADFQKKLLCTHFNQ
jgi:hypothetical protein